MNVLKNHPCHKKSIRQLYKRILVNVNKLDPELKQDLYSLTKQVFKRKTTDLIKISKSILQGIKLNESLLNKDHKLLQRMIQEEKENLHNFTLQKQSRKQNKQVIELKKINLLRGKAKSVRLSRRSWPSPPKKSKRKEIIKSFIDLLQRKNKLAKNVELDKLYIDTILAPNLQYELNKLYYDELVNRFAKGPYQAEIKFTFASGMGLPYMMSPYKHKVGRRELYQHIQKQHLYRRMLNIWESKENSKLEGEHMSKDGSYSVFKSSGFGDNELIYPKYHYEMHTMGEEMFELFLDIEQNPGKKLNLSKYNWSQFLNETSIWLAEEHKNLKYFDNVTSKQSTYQNKFNQRYDSELIKFQRLTKSLNESKVFKNNFLSTSLQDHLKNHGFKSFDLDDPDFDMTRITQKLNHIADRY